MTSVDALDVVLRRAVGVRVRDGDEPPVTVDGSREVTRLRLALTVAEVPDGACMCMGDVAFEFFGPDGRTIAAVGLHHGVSVRWSGWDGDALLSDGAAVLAWLADHGVDGPRRRAEAQAVARREHEESERRWRAAAPAAVRELLDSPTMTRALIEERLAVAIPEPVERTAALLRWYGSGSGLLSGFPSYEDLPAPALTATPIAHLVEALRAYPGADVEDGAVRHLCGWRSRKHPARDAACIPADIRERLIAAARRSGDPHKQRLTAERLMPER